MENGAWRETLAQNLSRLRREKGLTQAELGEKLNYSDKSISKWERGEGVPDLSVMMQLTDMYGVTLDEIVGIKTKEAPDAGAGRKDRILSHTVFIVTMESAIWLVALIVFFVLMLALPSSAPYWLSFIYALPVSFLSLGVCFLCWRFWLWAVGVLSAALWTICLSANLTAGAAYAGFIYAVGGLVQLTVIFVIGIAVYSKKHRRKK